MDPISIVTTGMNLAGGYVGYKMQEKQNEQNRAWQLQDRAHDEMYNSPALQRQRMYDAGIGGDYANLVQGVPTQSNTAEGKVSESAMAGLSSIGNTAADAYIQSESLGVQKEQLGINREVAKATAAKSEADARLATANAIGKEIDKHQQQYYRLKINLPSQTQKLYPQQY